jgi:ArsR family transcriptional regulator
MDSSEFLDLLGNDNRRRILQLLSQRPCYVTEIGEQLGVSPKAVIDHLKKLEAAGLVESRTDERRRKYFSIARHVRLEVTVSPYEFGTRSAYPANTRFDVTRCRRVDIDLDSRDPVGSDDTDDASPDAREDRSDAPSEADAQPSAAGRERRHPTERTDAASGERADATPSSGAGDDSSAAGELSSTRHRTQSTTTGEETSSAERLGELSSGRGASTPDVHGEPSTGLEVARLARRLDDLQQLERELALAHRWAEGRITQLREQIARRTAVGDPRFVSEVVTALAAEPRETGPLARELEAPHAAVEELLGVLESEGIVRRDGRRWRLVE